MSGFGLELIFVAVHNVEYTHSRCRRVSLLSFESVICFLLLLVYFFRVCVPFPQSRSRFIVSNALSFVCHFSGCCSISDTKLCVLVRQLWLLTFVDGDWLWAGHTLSRLEVKLFPFNNSLSHRHPHRLRWLMTLNCQRLFFRTFNWVGSFFFLAHFRFRLVHRFLVSGSQIGQICRPVTLFCSFFEFIWQVKKIRSLFHQLCCDLLWGREEDTLHRCTTSCHPIWLLFSPSHSILIAIKFRWVNHRV